MSVTIPVVVTIRSLRFWGVPGVVPDVAGLQPVISAVMNKQSEIPMERVIGILEFNGQEFSGGQSASKNKF